MVVEVLLKATPPVDAFATSAFPSAISCGFSHDELRRGDHCRSCQHLFRQRRAALTSQCIRVAFERCRVALRGRDGNTHVATQQVAVIRLTYYYGPWVAVSIPFNRPLGVYSLIDTLSPVEVNYSHRAFFYFLPSIFPRCMKRFPHR